MIPAAADADKRATWTFDVVVEPDEDAWFAHCPALKSDGAATCGSTRDEALRHIRQIVGTVVAGLVEEGEELPADVDGSEGTRVSVWA